MKNFASRENWWLTKLVFLHLNENVTFGETLFQIDYRIRMFEYERPGWTFHAKGIWHYLPGQALPCATLVGSPNFGYRDQNHKTFIETSKWNVMPQF